MIRVCPLSALPPGGALRVEAEPPPAASLDIAAREVLLGGADHSDGPRPATAVSSLLSGEAGSPESTRSTKAPYFWSDQYDVRIQFAGHALEADSVIVEEGSVESRSLLAVYRRGDAPVAVLGMNQPRLFGRWRRQLNAASATATL